MNLDIEQLKKDIAEFSDFKDRVQNRQLSFPLDARSIEVIHKDVLVPTGNVIFPFGLATYDDAVEVTVNDKKYLLDTSSEY